MGARQSNLTSGTTATSGNSGGTGGSSSGSGSTQTTPTGLNRRPHALLMSIGDHNRGRTRSLGSVAASPTAASTSHALLAAHNNNNGSLTRASVSGTSVSGGFGLHGHPHYYQQYVLNEFKCPVCSKSVLPDDVECHIVICLTKPRISYNDDVLQENKGECVICLDELRKGDTIARLPCLCIYHKNCIDAWFEVNRSCPEHPSD